MGRRLNHKMGATSARPETDRTANNANRNGKVSLQANNAPRREPIRININPNRDKDSSDTSKHEPPKHEPAQPAIQLDPTTKEEFLTNVRQSSTILVTGPTGCGKSTQIPLIIACAYPDARILIVQPRRLCTERLAHYLASLMGTTLGEQVGYFMGRCNITNPATRIFVGTAGAALNRLLAQPDHFNFIILDEIHEESSHIEQLKTVCKIAQRRYGFKVILMSATTNPLFLKSVFPRFYHFEFVTQNTVRNGTNFPVREHYYEFNMSKIFKDYNLKTLGDNMIKRDMVSSSISNIICYLDVAAFHLFTILDTWQSGDILVFLPGISAITDFMRRADMLAKQWVENKFGRKIEYKYWIIHSMCSEEYKLDVLQSMSGTSHIPNILLATTVCETSLTLPTLRYVVDTCLARENRYIQGKKKLVTTHASIESLIQRKGRVGRVAPGAYYCVLPKKLIGRLNPSYSKEDLLQSLPYILLFSLLHIEEGEKEDVERANHAIFSSIISELLITSQRFTIEDVILTLRDLVASSLIIPCNTTPDGKQGAPISLTHKYYKTAFKFRGEGRDTPEYTDSDANEDSTSQDSENRRKKDSTSDSSFYGTDDDSERPKKEAARLASSINYTKYSISERAVLQLILKYSLDKTRIFYWYFMLGIPYSGMVVFSMVAINKSVFISDVEQRISTAKLKDSVTSTGILLLAAVCDPDLFVNFTTKDEFYIALCADEYIKSSKTEDINAKAAVRLIAKKPYLLTLKGCSDNAAYAIILALWRKRFPIPTEHPTEDESNWCLLRCLSPYSMRQLELEIISCRSKLSDAGLISAPLDVEQLLTESIYSETNELLEAKLRTLAEASKLNKITAESWIKYAETNKYPLNKTLTTILREVQNHGSKYFELCALATVLSAPEGNLICGVHIQSEHSHVRDLIYEYGTPSKTVSSRYQILLSHWGEEVHSVKDSIPDLQQELVSPSNQAAESTIHALENTFSHANEAVKINVTSTINMIRRPWEDPYAFTPENDAQTISIVVSGKEALFSRISVNKALSMIHYMTLTSNTLIVGQSSITNGYDLVSCSYVTNGSLIVFLLHLLLNDNVVCHLYRPTEEAVQEDNEGDMVLFELRRFDQEFYRIKLYNKKEQNAFACTLLAVGRILTLYCSVLRIFNVSAMREESQATSAKYLTDSNLCAWLSEILGSQICIDEPTKRFLERTASDSADSPILAFGAACVEFMHTYTEADDMYVNGLLNFIDLVDIEQYDTIGTVTNYLYQKGTSAFLVT